MLWLVNSFEHPKHMFKLMWAVLPTLWLCQAISIKHLDVSAYNNSVNPTNLLTQGLELLTELYLCPRQGKINIKRENQLWWLKATVCLWQGPSLSTIRPPDKRAYQKIIFFLFLNQNICCGYSKEPFRWDSSYELPIHMFKLMGKKIITVLCYSFLLNWSYGAYLFLFMICSKGLRKSFWNLKFANSPFSMNFMDNWRSESMAKNAMSSFGLHPTLKKQQKYALCIIFGPAHVILVLVLYS